MYYAFASSVIAAFYLTILLSNEIVQQEINADGISHVNDLHRPFGQ